MASVTILSDNGATSGSAGLKTSGGNDGVLLLQTTTSGGTPTTAISISNTQVVTYTNQPTYTGGTANGVLYLNGSKAVTSGTALVFNGTNFGVNFTPSAWQTYRNAIQLGSSGASINAYANAGDTNQILLSGSGYADSTGTWKYTVTNGNGVGLFGTTNGAFTWQTAGSGTAGNTISFSTLMTLTTSGQLLIGTTSSSQALELVNNQNTVTRARITNTSTGSGAIAEWSSYNGSNQTTVAMYGTNTTSSGVLTPSTGYLFTDSSSLSLVVSGTSGVIKFGSGAGFGEIARFTSAGNLVLAGGTTSANGIGVTFPASQSASTDANCLDDYEEGTWTPSYFGTSGNPTVSYSKQVGRYVKIGRMVYWGVAIVVSTTSGGSGTLYINGPFTSLSTGANTWGGLSTWNGGGTFSGQQPSDFALINGTNNMYLHTRSTTGASSDVPVSALLNGSNIEAFGMYEV